MLIKEHIYHYLPVPLQNLSCSWRGLQLRRSRFSQEIYDDVECSGALDHDEWCEMRDARIRAFVEHSVNTVPFYRRTLKNKGIDHREIRGLDDLHILPIIDKALVKENIEDFRSDAVQGRRCRYLRTSGTTGSMLTVPMTPSAQIRQWAVWWRFRRWHGIQRDTWCAQFTNRPIVRADNNNGPFWRYNWPSRQILFSVNHTNEANMIKYIEELRHAQPPWIHGIVSSIAYLASYIVGKKIDLGYEVKFVTVASENLHNHQKKTIEEAFGVPVRTHYGLVEGVANISERPDGLYHIDEDFAAVEFIPLVHTSGYRIVGTNFSNPAFPLIRYDTGDIASLPEQDVESPFPGRIVGSFDGRSYDFIVLADGRHTHTIIGVFQAVDHIREAQISQVEPGQARILIVPDSNYTAKDECSIRRNIQSLYGNMLEISFEYVRAIPRTKSGKLRFITSTCNKWPSKDCSVLSYDGV